MSGVEPAWHSGNVPKGWAVAPLAILLSEDLMNGHSVPTAEHGFPVLRLTALRHGRIDLSESKIGRWSRDEARRYLVQQGDFLIARGNGSLRLVGRGGLVRHIVNEVAFPDTMIRIRPHGNLLVPEFLGHQWESLDIRRQIERVAKTTAGIHKVSQGDLRNLALVVAPLREQRRIVAEIEKQFTRLDEAVATLRAVQVKLKRARASVLKAAVEGRLVPTEAELARAEGRSYEPAATIVERLLAERVQHSGALRKRHVPASSSPPLARLPEGWTWVPMEHLTSSQERSIQSGPFGSSLRHSEFQAEGCLVIGIDNVRDGWFSIGANHRIAERRFRELERYRARGHDLLITVMATVGRCCLVPADIEPAIITKHVYRITLEHRVAEPRFVMHVVRGAPAVREQVVSESRGQTRAGINGAIIKKLWIPIPPTEEQTRIVAEVERRLSVLDALERTVEQNLARCERLRQSILKRAFEGKLVPQDPADEPASELLARIRAQRAEATA